MRLGRAALLALLTVGSTLHAASSEPDKPFDPKRDPEADLLAAEKQAAAEHKNILLDFGGNWCGPCLLLDQTLHGDAELAARLERSYVVVHVAVAPMFTGKVFKEFEKQFPKVKSFPHIMILAADGTLVHDQLRTDLLSDDNGKGISHRVLGEFLERWAPKTQATHPIGPDSV